MAVLSNGLDPRKLSRYLLERGSLVDDDAKADVAEIICQHKMGTLRVGSPPEIPTVEYFNGASFNELVGGWDERLGEWNDGVTGVPVRSGILPGQEWRRGQLKRSHAPEIHALENAREGGLRQRTTWDGKGLPCSRHAQKMGPAAQGVRGCTPDNGITLSRGIVVHALNYECELNHDIAMLELLAACQRPNGGRQLYLDALAARGVAV